MCLLCLSMLFDFRCASVSLSVGCPLIDYVLCRMCMRGSKSKTKSSRAKLESSESERCITEVSVGRRITAVMQ